MPSTIRLILCDDQAIVTEGLQVILGTVPSFEVVAVAHDGAEAVDLVEEFSPDLVLMDLRMPIMNGIQATGRIRERFPETRVLVLTTYDEDGWVFDAIRAGADGYLLKDTPREDLIAAIRGTVEGGSYVDPSVAGKLLKQLAQPGASPQNSSIGDDLSERELEVLGLLANGLTNAEIAERLHLTKGTVQNHLSSLFVKLDVTDRTQAALLALRHGLVS